MMKASSTVVPQKLRNHDSKSESGLIKLSSFLFISLAIITVSGLFFLYSPNPFNILKLIPKQAFITTPSLSPSSLEQSHYKTSLNNTLNDNEICDLSGGQWIEGLRRSNLYSNSSCATIPESKNCFAFGRKDSEFLNWKWKPTKCELPSFDAKRFLEMVNGKKMAFLGDSVARNHVESLLCLLAPEETPSDIYKDSEDRFREWYFPRHDFTLKVLWTKFLVKGTEKTVNGTGTSAFDLYLDEVEESWSRNLPELDYLIISGGHWFFRVMYLNEARKSTGCVYCSDPKLVVRPIGFALRISFRSALSFINRCKDCKPGLVVVVRTFAPAHFEGGDWNTGGHCNRTKPLKKADISTVNWEMRNIQVEEVELARREGLGRGNGFRFAVLDITRAMLMRPDGHPGTHWPNKWMKGFSDCVHWCLPGPVDYWNDFLLEVLRRQGLV